MSLVGPDGKPVSSGNGRADQRPTGECPACGARAERVKTWSGFGGHGGKVCLDCGHEEKTSAGGS